MLLTITNFINYISGFNVSFIIISVVTILLYVYLIYHYYDDLMNNTILLSSVIILMILDLFCIYYIHFYKLNDKKHDVHLEKENQKDKNKNKKKNKNKTSEKKKSIKKNDITFYNKDKLSSIETYKTLH